MGPANRAVLFCSYVLHLTFVSAARIVKGFASDGASHRLTERPESSTHDPSTTVLS